MTLSHIAYREINKALENELGKDVVKLRPAIGKEWIYELSFREDKPSQELVEKSIEIVGKFGIKGWQTDKWYNSENW